MADRIIQSDSGNDVVIQNDDASKKVVIPDSDDVTITGDLKTTTLKATNLKANDGTAGLVVADSTGEVESSGGLKAINVKTTNLKANDGTASLVIADSTGRVQVSEKIEVDDILEKTSGHGVEIDGIVAKDDALVTKTNKYAYLESGELNSKGYLKNNFFGACYYLNTDVACTHNVHEEINGTWLAFDSATGVSSNDPFARFNQPSAGRWKPTIAGFYLISYSIKMESIDDQSTFITSVLKNSTEDDVGGMTGFVRVNASGTSTLISSGTGIIPLDTDDYVSLYAYQNTGSDKNVATDGNTTIGITYIGETL
jgi:hypothetical protein